MNILEYFSTFFLFSILLISCSVNKENILPLYNNPSLSVEERVESLLEHLSLEEKAGFMSGETMWYLQEIPRLGIPKMQVTDCGHGVTVILDDKEDYSGCATCFPTAVGQGGTWDQNLIFEMGAALGRETRALGSGILLAPMVNLHRIPVGGRNYETYSEDPFLTGKLASAFINGVQSENIGTVIKAVTANNQQYEQDILAAVISERVLREMYLPAFRIPIKESNPVGLMTAYNGVNGVPTSESKYLITEIVKGEWEYDGFVISDWRAVVSSKSISAGVDIEMPGPGEFMDVKDIIKAIKDGLISEKEVSMRAARYLRAVVKSKVLDIPKVIQNAEFNTPRHQELARKVAEGSIVLLKNKDNILPLKNEQIKTIAVFGPNAEEARLGGGGSASVSACYTVSPLKGLQNKLGLKTQIEFIEGAGITGDLPVIGSKYFSTIKNGKTVEGLSAEYFDGQHLEGSAQCSRIDDKVDYSWGWAAPCEYVTKNGYSVRWTGKINAPETGKYKIGLTVNEGGARLYLDGELVIDEWGNPGNEITEAIFVYKSKSVVFEMEKGSSHDIYLEFHKKHNKNLIRLEWEMPNTPSPIEDAVDLAKKSDVAIIYAGLSNIIEGGNNDKEDIRLPGNQDKLISEVAKVNPNTIVVLINGTPLEMPWIGEVKAVLEAFYPGQEGGNAIANILMGDVNPSGKLPDTYAKKMSDYLSMKYYPGENGEIPYTEGLKIGYRQFDEDKIEPLFPFGFGLSYTTFEFSNMSIVQKGRNLFTVNLDVMNTGSVDGAEVVQVYIRDINSSVYRPIKELKGFDKIFLQSGEKKRIQINLDEDSFSFYSEKKSKWTIESGSFEIMVGNSSRNILLRDIIIL